MKHKLTALSYVVTLVLLILFFPAPTFAQSAWSGPCISGSGQEAVATIKGVECLVKNLLNIAIRLIGIAMFVMIVLGGFKMVAAGGDPKGMESGKQTLTYGIMGLVMAVLSWFILLIFSNFSGVEQLLEFQFPTL